MNLKTNDSSVLLEVWHSDKYFLHNETFTEAIQNLPKLYRGHQYYSLVPNCQWGRNFLGKSSSGGGVKFTLSHEYMNLENCSKLVCFLY